MFKLEIDMKNRTPRGIKKDGKGWGYRAHNKRASIRVMIGDKI